MRTPVLTFIVSSVLSVSIAIVLFALGAPAAIGSAFAWLFREEMPYITAALALIGEIYSGFNTAYPAFLVEPLTWRPDLLMAMFTTPENYGIAAGYFAANLTVASAMLLATVLLVVSIQAVCTFLIGGTAGLRLYAQVLCRKVEAVGLS